MATLKFNYGGTNYELVAKDTKITTPSIKVVIFIFHVLKETSAKKLLMEIKFIR